MAALYLYVPLLMSGPVQELQREHAAAERDRRTGSAGQAPSVRVCASTWRCERVSGRACNVQVGGAGVLLVPQSLQRLILYWAAGARRGDAHCVSGNQWGSLQGG